MTSGILFFMFDFRELIKDIKDLVAKNTCEVAEFWIIHPHVVVSRMLEVFVRTQSGLWAVQ